MANMQSKHLKDKTSSGISKLKSVPAILPYPKLMPFESSESIHNIFCYIIKHYGTHGLSVLVYRKDGQVTVLFGDWNGNSIDIQTDNPTDLTIAAKKFIDKDLTKFVNLMYSINIEQAQYFLAMNNNDLILVDIQLSLNKLAGPGMVRDIFGKIYPTQEIKKVEIIDERSIEYINQGTGSYSDDLILKPSRFRMHHDQKKNSFQPLYSEVRR